MRFFDSFDMASMVIANRHNAAAAFQAYRRFYHGEHFRFRRRGRWRFEGGIRRSH